MIEVTRFAVPGPALITPKRFADSRGFFSETYSARALSAAGIESRFVQDNHSLSVDAFTVRGLHFQTPPCAQAKLVRVVRGRALDVALDLRKGSPTFGNHVAVELSADNWRQFFIPIGFAHGFCTLESNVEILYKVSDYYSAESELGIRWNDAALNIPWPDLAGNPDIGKGSRAAEIIGDRQSVLVSGGSGVSNPRPIRILQFGSTGQLGREMRACAPSGNVQIRALGRDEANFTNPDDIGRAVGEAADVDVVVNTVAYTAVDRAEQEEELAEAVNSRAVAALARACAARALPLIHISTDYVFDGTKNTAYGETDMPNPLNVYGRTKLAGEAAIREFGAPHVILRTSWLYSPYGSNFVKTMLRLAAERDELRVVSDQFGAPTAAGDLAAAIVTIAEGVMAAPTDGHFGTFHYAGAGATTWYGFADAILHGAKPWAGSRARLIPIPAADYPAAARRPQNSRLDCTKIETVYGISPEPWENSLARVLEAVSVQEGFHP